LPGAVLLLSRGKNEKLTSTTY
jgi:hypothetical protein